MSPLSEAPVRRRPRRRLRVTVAAGLIALSAPLAAAPVLASPAGPSAPAADGAAARERASFPTSIPLPDGFQPEGIAIRGTSAYLGSRADGDLYRVDLRTGRGTTISQGPGTASVGLKIDRLGRLFVAGGDAGTVRVVDARTGRLLRTYRVAAPGAETFVNDVLITAHDVWVTDSRAARLTRIPLGRGGRLPAAARSLPLSGAWTQDPGVNNANGLTTTPDGRALLVVDSSDGRLHRVDPRTGVTTVVDLGGAALTNGDGLLRTGRTLLAVQNRLNRVAVVRLSTDGRSGRLVRTLTDERFDVPTTVARLGSRLYLPNARFSTPPTPTTTYAITAIELRR
ncbi:SMP-30/gluconolactonase/LRE family protein [Nocardioides sp. TRM66260-LWL]|uniref:SMP-30/gluconolactonase/LRE family protein n=1 Tax=Nocardioides sp. TRM66260-LWL TaxID=2874478 RepID=UPI001CC41ACF|nr:SMP-30/gluconolactonase/LRE family protein [Nocardioides sp. TRM66260-LWL]MBZ5734191.1 SMP-30/gluconolactonase/LRE family protein [Nocardioides sp. TRM66260-LWL]